MIFRRTGQRHHLGSWAALLAAAAVLAGCSGSGADSATRDDASVARPAAGLASGPASGEASSSDEQAAGGGKEVTGDVEDQKLIRSATISLQVENINQATAKVRAINATARGVIVSENIGSYREGGVDSPDVNPDTYAVLVISVPVASLDKTLDQLQTVGEVLDRRSDTENVTAEYVDVQARVGSMKKAVARIQDLIDSTKDIDQLIRLERELSNRQAELESVQARLQSLDRQVSRSPITVNLATEPDLISEFNPADGFLGGLSAGWRAFVGSVVALLTVLGAALPFVAFALLVGAPTLWLWRRRRHPAPPEPDSAASAPTPRGPAPQAE